MRNNSAAIRSPWAARGVLALLLLAGIGIAAAGPAHADAGPSPSPSLPSDDVFNGLTDSHGVPADKYTVVPFDRGGMDNLSKLVTGIYIDQGWPGIVYVVKGGMWLLSLVLSFKWVDFLAAPFVTFTTTLQNLMGGFAIIPLALSITGLVAGIAFGRGRHASGGIAIVSTVIAASLLTGILANPATTFFGPGGLVKNATDFGGQIAVSMATDGSDTSGRGLTPEDAVNASVNQKLADVFLREPVMYVAFGKRLTGNCEQVFDEKMKAVAAGDTSSNSVRDAVAACDPQAKYFIDHPQGQIVVLIGVSITVGVLLLMVFVLALLVGAAVLFLGFRCVVLLIDLYKALFPGDSKADLLRDLGFAGAAVAFLAGSLVVLVMYLRLVIELMKSLDSLGPMKYLLLASLFAGGIVVFVRFRKRLKEMGARAAAALSRAMRSAPAAQPRQPVTARSVVNTVRRGYNAANGLRTANALHDAAASRSASPSTAAKPAPRIGGPKTQAALRLASKIPGVGGAVATGTMAALRIHQAAKGVKAGALAAAEGVRRAGDGRALRSAHNTLLRSRLGRSEAKAGKAQERMHRRLDAVDAQRERFGSRDARRAGFDAKEALIRGKAANSNRAAVHAERLRAKLERNERIDRKLGKNAAARRAADTVLNPRPPKP
ncbi:hypothetical protein SPF06_18960 [Sinomonas sp. JGH33]|uniref:TrbL/VirB6 plasmid conjugal transfer protein n=1 Tax=Sinomonas terricola TaxID=3110330 RepID=A0ABU5TAV1_9MICC|nr:hypothetical protein [Sinomonas sp. JGH33]MEA5456808.1 hypothetical protein [Sinomonas sp. JGH33]